MLRIIGHPIRLTRCLRTIHNARIRTHVPNRGVPRILSKHPIPDPSELDELDERDVQRRPLSLVLALTGRVDTAVEVVQPGEDSLDECVASGSVCAAAVDVRDEEGATVGWGACQDAYLGENNLGGGLQFGFAVRCTSGRLAEIQ